MNVRPSQIKKGSASARALDVHSRASVAARASSLNGREGRKRDPRQVDAEDASPVRKVAGIDPAIVRFDAHAAEGEAKAHAGSIGPPLLERAKQLVDIPTRETTALVLDLDEHAFGAGANAQRQQWYQLE